MNLLTIKLESKLESVTEMGAEQMLKTLRSDEILLHTKIG